MSCEDSRWEYWKHETDTGNGEIPANESLARANMRVVKTQGHAKPECWMRSMCALKWPRTKKVVVERKTGILVMSWGWVKAGGGRSEQRREDHQQGDCGSHDNALLRVLAAGGGVVTDYPPPPAPRPLLSPSPPTGCSQPASEHNTDL